MMLDFKTAGSDNIKTVVSAIATLVEEATFVATNDGIAFRGMDPSHVALVDVRLAPSSFEKYECGDGEVKFGVRIDELGKVIKRASKRDSLAIGIGDDSKIGITMGGGGRKKYSLRLMESAESDTPIPKLDYTVEFVIDAAGLEKAIADVGVMSDYVTFDVPEDGEKITVSGRGDSGEASVEIIPADSGDVEVKKHGAAACKSMYSAEYIAPVVKAVAAGAGGNCPIRIEYSENKPVRLTFKLDGESEISFYLAPRVES